MNINYKQPQFELFPGGASAGNDATKPRFFLANLTLTIENLVVLSILGIMLAVFAYSLGVERGKHVMVAQMMQRAPAKPLAAHVPVVAVQQAAFGKSKSQAEAAAVVPAPVQSAQSVSTGVIDQKPKSVGSSFKYTVQVASYADEKFAQRAALVLGKKGFETIVMQKGKYAILCVGKFQQKNEAMATIVKLKSQYKDCLVRSM